MWAHEEAPAVSDRGFVRAPYLCGFWGVRGYGGTQTRTGDTTIFSRVLYQLSYPAAQIGPETVGVSGAGIKVRRRWSAAARPVRPPRRVRGDHPVGRTLHMLAGIGRTV